MQRTVKSFCYITISAARADPGHKQQYGFNVTAFDNKASPKQQHEHLEEANRRLSGKYDLTKRTYDEAFPNLETAMDGELFLFLNLNE